MRLGKGKQEFLLKIAILATVYVLAFSTRLFSVLRYESVIHEVFFSFSVTLSSNTSGSTIPTSTFAPQNIWLRKACTSSGTGLTIQAGIP